MAPRLAVFILFMLLFSCLFAAAADGQKKAVNTDDRIALTDQTCDPIVTAKELEAQISGWAENWPENERVALNKIDGPLHALLACDMVASEKVVRQLAHHAALSDPTEVTDNSYNPHLEFEEALAILNAKEKTLRQLRTANDLASKYRRLGDYLNLLRRQLRLPILKLAAVSERKTGVDAHSQNQ